MSKKDIPICADCVYCENNSNPFAFPKFINVTCNRPRKQNKIDLITGGPVKRFYTCSQERSGMSIFGWCGKKGKYFKPKQKECNEE